MAAGETIMTQNFIPETLPAAVWEGNVLSDLSHFGLISVDGPDARKFLANLFTGDVRLVSPQLGQFTSWCDGKGRILCTFWLFMRGEAFYLLLPSELVPSTLTRLRQFLLRSKANILDASASLSRLGLSGPELAAPLVSLLGGEIAEARGTTTTLGDFTLLALSGNPHPRWLLLAPAEAIAPVQEVLQAHATLIESGAWSLLDILAGFPLITSETSGEFIPQMLNLEALGGLSFTKGCYPGQEVVARLQYRGQLKRRLYTAYVQCPELPLAGSKLFGPGTTESVGMVISAAPEQNDRIALLAVVVIDHKNSGNIHLHDLQGPLLEFLETEVEPLPNPVEEAPAHA